MLYFQFQHLLNASKRERRDVVLFNTFSIKWWIKTPIIPSLRTKRKITMLIIMLCRNSRCLISNCNKRSIMKNMDNNMTTIIHLMIQFIMMYNIIMEIKQLTFLAISSQNFNNFGIKMNSTSNIVKMFNFIPRRM